MDKVTPETLYKELSKTVIGQEGYLKSLSNAAWLHSLRYQHYKHTGEALDKPKQNILCIGPSGTGKTLAVEQLGRLLNLPVVIENASMLRGEGWKGRSVSSIIARCIDAAPDKNEAEATHSIVCLDEIDKVFKSRPGDQSFLPVDNLLTFMAGSVVVHTDNNRTRKMDTSRLLIVCLGAFEGLEDIIRERMAGKSSIGFSAKKPAELPEGSLLPYVTEDDLHTYGISHEFLGRISLITHTNPLSLEDYNRILIQSDASPVYQYDRLLHKTIGVHAGITEEAAACMARQAMGSKEGARLLARTVTDLLQPELHTVAGDASVDSIEIGCGVDNSLVAYQTHMGREDLWEDFCIGSPETDSQTLSSVPLSCIRGRNEIVELAKSIKDASPRKVLLTEEETIAAVYLLAAAIAFQLVENNGKGMTMDHVAQMLDRFYDPDTRDMKCFCVHPLEHIGAEFFIEAEKHVRDWDTKIVYARQMLLDYCNAWICSHGQAEQ